MAEGPTPSRMRFLPASKLSERIRRGIGAVLVFHVVLTAGLVFVNGCGDEGKAPDTDASGNDSNQAMLVRVAHHGKWGYVDSSGRVRIPLRYSSALRFSNGRAPVEQRGKWGLIDRNGAAVVEPSYRTIRYFHGDLYACARPGPVAGTLSWVLLDAETGHERRLPGVMEIGHSNGHPLLPFRSVAEDGGQDGGSADWGYLGTDGNVAIQARFTEATWFEGKLARVRVGRKWGLIGREGNFVVQPTLDFINFIEPAPLMPWRKRFYRVRNEGLYGYIRPDGRWLLRPQFEVASEFAQQWAAVCTREGVWGFTDTIGRMRLAMAETDVPEGRPINGFWNGLAAVHTKGGAVAWIDRSGKVRIKPQEMSLTLGRFDYGASAGWLRRDGKRVVSALMDSRGALIFGPRRCMIFHVPWVSRLWRISVSEESENIWTYVTPEGKILWLPEGHPWKDADRSPSE
ncbi:MAG: WG repeat-containing protein [Planctomycetota bacterium]